MMGVVDNNGDGRRQQQRTAKAVDDEGTQE
jgi:hypothetical protein